MSYYCNEWPMYPDECDNLVILNNSLHNTLSEITMHNVQCMTVPLRASHTKLLDLFGSLESKMNW